MAYDSQSFKEWLSKIGYNLKQKTHGILSDQGFDTLGDFKNLDMDDFEGLCKDHKIPYADKAKLKRILESFSSKDKFIDPEEVEAITNIKDEINKLQKTLDNLKLTQTEINDKKQKISKEINDTIDDLVNKLRSRQKELLVKLDGIIDGDIVGSLVGGNVDLDGASVGASLK